MSAERPVSGIRGFVERVATFAVFGALAGGVVFAVEAFDRVRVLRHNLDSVTQGASLVLLTAASIPLVMLLATVAGTLWTSMDSIRRVVEPRLPESLARFRRLTAVAVAALVIAACARVASGVFPSLGERFVVSLVRRIHTRLFSLGPIGSHPKIAYTIGLVVATAVLLVAYRWLFERPSGRGRLASIAAALGGLAFVLVGYGLDSRVEFTRYEWMFHIPLEVLYSIGAAVALIALARAFADPGRAARAFPVLAAACLTLALGGVAIVYGAAEMDASQNVKALFWGRSIAARRVFQLARLASDRDRDGFASAFGGGDLDDRDPAVRPMAAEIAGNGVDDNAIGGDLASSDQTPGALYSASVGGPVQPVAGPRDVLVLSVDCLRADHLSCYGYRKPTSPNIDRFAAELLLFENAYAQGTNTGHSFTSMYRSSYGDDIFDDRVTTFARILRDRGYTTEFLNSIRTDAWLNANRWEKYKVLMDDFDVVHSDGERFWNAEVVTDRAIELLDKQDPAKPHFTWVHYFDCHRPRRRHPEHNFGRNAAGAFDSNVAFVDEHLGRLFDHLRESGALDRTIVFVIADHGEAFMEHGAQDHSNKPYNNNTLVPLIVHVPGTAPARVFEPCGLIDVGPTALAFVGSASPAFYRGIDLVGALRSGGLPVRQIVSETPRNLIESSFYTWALVDWPYKILWDVRSNTTEIYDLESDPGEQHNLVDRDPALAGRMRAALGAWLDRETARTGAIGPGDEGLTEGDGD